MDIDSKAEQLATCHGEGHPWACVISFRGGVTRGAFYPAPPSIQSGRNGSLKAGEDKGGKEEAETNVISGREIKEPEMGTSEEQCACANWSNKHRKQRRGAEIK